MDDGKKILAHTSEAPEKEDTPLFFLAKIFPRELKVDKGAKS